MLSINECKKAINTKTHETWNQTKSEELKLILIKMLVIQVLNANKY
jgi:hypothetical protein